ncbi:hypothetical protein ACFPRL_36040 [Pseudoclavibacter helvolus]
MVIAKPIASPFQRQPRHPRGRSSPRLRRWANASGAAPTTAPNPAIVVFAASALD